MRNDWTDYFDDLILRRGKEYFNNGYVRGYAETGDSCMARVIGTEIYYVRITGLKSGNLWLQCECPYAMDGHRCKHEAALLYYWQKHHEEKKDILANEKLKSDGMNTYFNVRKMLENENIEEETLEKARGLIKNNLIEVEKISLNYVGMNRDYESDSELVLIIDGKILENRAYSSSVRIMLAKDRIYTKDCFARHANRHVYNGYYSSYYNRICEHQMAMILLADEYIAKYNPGDETDLIGNRILNGYKLLSSHQKIDETIEKGKIIKLQPKLSISTSGDHLSLFMNFKIGMEKLYALRNIPELIETRKEFGALKLGKTNSISFMDYDFDDESTKYYELIEDAKAEADFIEEKLKSLASYSYGYSMKAVIKEKMQLSPELLDKFYDMALGKSFELAAFRLSNGEDYLHKLTIGTGKPSCVVTVSGVNNEKGDFSGISVEALLPRMLRGKECSYCINEERGVLSRVEALSPVMQLLLDNATDGRASFNIGKKNISEFYYRFLPQLIEAPEIEVVEKNTGLIEKNIPPECEIIFYMDAEDDSITGRVAAKYGEDEIRVHQLQDSDYPLPENRDFVFEQNAISALRDYLPSTDDNGENFYCEKNGDNTFELLNNGLRDLMAIGEIRASKDFERLKIRRAPQVRLGVSVESGILNLDIATDDMSEDELLDLLESYRKKKKFFRMRNGEFIRLELDDTLEELVATMQSMGITAKEFTKGKLHLPLYRAIYINKLLEEHDDIATERDKNFKNLIKNFNAVKEADIEVPENLSKVLRGYQTYGFKWLSTLADLGFGGILADDMGLGKTIQVITFLQSRKELSEKENKKISALIVCPASLVYNWEEEFKRFAPEIKVQTVTGTQSERKKFLTSKALPDVFVTSYDLLKRDIGSYENLKFDYEIIDEAQFIKNSSAAVSKSVKVINSTQRFALTGTPIENRLSELWSIFDYLMPGFLYTYDRFKSDFETAITKYKDEEVTKQLRNMVGPFILRRLKENVLKDLPDKIEEIRFSRFEPAQRKLYDAQVTHMKRVLESEDYRSCKDRLKVLAELTKIRQICCDPELITAGYTGESAKRASCIELIQSAIDGGHKILLFSQFTSMLELLENDLHKEGIEYYKITGQTSKEDRIKLVHAFNENEVPLFLISLKAGGTGLNLTGADVVIHYDPWWNLAAQNQATDRAHRIGQTKKVSVFKLIAKDTIEEKIVEMQNAKKDLANAILSGESESLTNMSKDQLMELLGF